MKQQYDLYGAPAQIVARKDPPGMLHYPASSDVRRKIAWMHLISGKKKSEIVYDAVDLLAMVYKIAGPMSEMTADELISSMKQYIDAMDEIIKHKK